MGLRVLLLEGDDAIAGELERALGERSFDVRRIASAGEGLDAAASQAFDVIFVSTELPGANGFELCDRIKSDPATAGVPVFVIPRPLASSQPSRRPSLSAPSGEVREALKNQERVVASLRADLSNRSQVIAQLTTKCKELTQRLTEVQALLETERTDRANALASLAEVKEAHAAELRAIEARYAEEAAERERAHAEETAFLEHAHANASDAAAGRLRDSQRALVAERAAHAADSETRVLEIADLRELAASLTRERDAAVHERDEARSLLESNLMSEQDRMLARTTALESDLADTKAKLAETARALDASEREAAQQQLARDAAFHDMSVRAAAEVEAAVKAAKAQAAKEREELVRAHEAAIVVVRDKAIAQALAVARDRKKQSS